MGILNYTTTVPADKTVQQVQAILVKSGARHISAAYTDGVVDELIFDLNTEFGTRAYRMPANVAGVQAAMAHDRAIDRRYKTVDQARRVAWRILKDWIEAQLAIIAAGLATSEQVLLPYMLDSTGRQTMFEAWRGDQIAIEGAS